MPFQSNECLCDYNAVLAASVTLLRKTTFFIVDAPTRAGTTQAVSAAPSVECANRSDRRPSFQGHGGLWSSSSGVIIEGARENSSGAFQSQPLYRHEFLSTRKHEEQCGSFASPSAE